MESKHKLISTEEAAKILGVCRQTVVNWISKGVMKAHKIGNFSMLDADTVKALTDTAQETEEAEMRLKELKQSISEQLEEAEREVRNIRRINGLTSRYAKVGVLSEIIEPLYTLVKSDKSLKRYEKGFRVLDLLARGKDLKYISEHEMGYHIQTLRAFALKAMRQIAKLRNYNEIIDENNKLRELNKFISFQYEQVLEEKRTLMARLNLESEKEEGLEYATEEDKATYHLLQTPICDLNLSVRAINVLKAMDIKTLGDLVQYNKSDFLRQRNLGKKTLIEIKDLLDSLNLDFGIDISFLMERINNTFNLERIKADGECAG